MKYRYLLIPFFIFIIILYSVSVGDTKVPEIVLEQRNAIVTIFIYEEDELKANGSGFIIDSTGMVATNYHVVYPLFENPGTTIAIKMNNGEFIKAKSLIAFDENFDIALIQVEEKELPAIKLARDYSPKLGEDVVVIGSPFGLEATISNGIISSIRGADEFLQITAPISPGSSGSPVFNSDGEVIGMATLIIEGGQNLNFAIPGKHIINIRETAQTAKSGETEIIIPAKTYVLTPVDYDPFESSIDFSAQIN